MASRDGTLRSDPRSLCTASVDTCKYSIVLEISAARLTTPLCTYSHYSPTRRLPPNRKSRKSLYTSAVHVCAQWEGTAHNHTSYLRTPFSCVSTYPRDSLLAAGNRNMVDSGLQRIKKKEKSTQKTICDVRTALKHTRTHTRTSHQSTENKQKKRKKR